jgi:molybdate transport system substrate-binding protein
MRWLVVLLLAAACTPNPSPRTTVSVLAASSLAGAFAAEGKAFEKSHPDLHVVLSFAGSQALVAQLAQGVPADALATADVDTMRSVRDRLDGQPVVFAHNRLAILVAPGNPLHVSGLADLAHLKVVLAGPTVPVGKAAAKALRAAGVRLHPVSLEDSVSGVVGKVRLGEADAGIAYVTDARAAGKALAAIAVPDSRTDLAIAALGARGQTFVRFVLSPGGQRVLASYGFT